MRYRSLSLCALLALFVLLAGCRSGGEAVPTPEQLDEGTAVLYYMSFTCPVCKRLTPAMNELYARRDKDYRFLALAYGTAPEAIGQVREQSGSRFPVVAGSREQRERYAINSTPSFIFMQDGKARERYLGADGARRLARVLESGAYRGETGILELAAAPERFMGRELRLRGKLYVRGRDAQGRPCHVLSNSREHVLVEPWLPTVVAPAPPGMGKPRPAVMGDFLRQELMVRGRLHEVDGEPRLQVESAELAE